MKLHRLKRNRDLGHTSLNDLVLETITREDVARTLDKPLDDVIDNAIEEDASRELKKSIVDLTNAIGDITLNHSNKF